MINQNLSSIQNIFMHKFNPEFISSKGGRNSAIYSPLGGKKVSLYSPLEFKTRITCRGNRRSQD